VADGSALDTFGIGGFWRKPIFRVTIASLALVAILFLFVFPTRTFLGQRSETNDVKHQLDVLKQQNKALEDEKARLQSDAEIERVARDRYNLVMPGEKSYAIIPGAVPSTTTAPPAPTATTAPSGASADANDAPPQVVPPTTAVPHTP